MMSPAVPASSLEFSAALYSVGGVGWNTTLMSGCAFSKAGMILSCQIGRSSLRQLSMVSVVSAAAGAAMSAAAEREASNKVRTLVFNITFSLFVADRVLQVDRSSRRNVLCGDGFQSRSQVPGMSFEHRPCVAHGSG